VEHAQRSIEAKQSVFLSVEAAPLTLDFTSRQNPSKIREVEEW
jgi:hypothetical protein